MDQPGYIIRLVRTEPVRNRTRGNYVPPDEGYGPRGIDVDLNGVVWTVLSSGHLASFDRSKCKGPLNGPQAVTGKLCPEGWAPIIPAPQSEA